MLLKKLSLCLSLALVLSACSAKSIIKTNKDEPANQGQPISTTSGSSNIAKFTKDDPKVNIQNPSDTPTILTKSFTPIEVTNKSELQTKKITWSWLYSCYRPAILSVNAHF